jgi:ubiquinone/menaquinone biosynthesis C-methylase UbiE
MSNVNIAAKVQKKIIDRLVCPITKSEVEILPIAVAADAIQEGVIVSKVLNKIVGVIRNFQFDFIRFDNSYNLDVLRNEIQNKSLPIYNNRTNSSIFIEFNDDIFNYVGNWSLLENEFYMCNYIDGNEFLQFKIDKSFVLELEMHPWSGVISIFKNDILFSKIDLYEPHMNVPKKIDINIDSETNIRIQICDEANINSLGKQFLFKGISIKSEDTVDITFDKLTSIRGASFPDKFYEILNAVNSDGIILDIGGGSRQISDERYVNIDYAPLLQPDVIGDALNLPFASNSIDFVYTSGVFEHLSNPKAAGDEVYRVLKKNGNLLACVAFMQPIHSEGQHFFNSTVWGIEEIFHKLEKDNTWWEGSMQFIVQWIINCAKINATVSQDEITDVLNKIADWDRNVKYENLKYYASAVWIQSHKA